MEMEMEMRANQDVSIGTDVTPPLPPFASSLYDSHLSSFCSSCFSPLQSTPFLPNSSFSSHRTPNSLFYCSSQCFSSDSPLHFSSAENHLLSTSHGGDTSDLRLALRLLLIFTDYPQHQHRIRGLLTNRDKLMSPENSDDEEISRRIRDGAKAMATARRMRDGEGFNVEGEDAAEEEAVLCLVLTNAVEVHVDGGQTIGLAVYDTAFSWINHSCSPSACYRFLTSVSSAWPSFSGQSRLQIIPGGGDCHIDTQIGNGVCCKTKFTKGYHASGPRIVVRSIKAIQKGDEVTVAYTDLLQPKSMRQSELWLKYRFICCCSRCSMMPPTYADCALQLWKDSLKEKLLLLLLRV